MAASAIYVVLMGVQGSGKGTQAEKLSAKLGIPHITSGGLFREMKNQDTPLAREVQDIMNAGKLVPDDVTIRIVGQRLGKEDAARGAILDGFPRTRPQAEALDALLTKVGSKVTIVPYLELDKATAIKRITDRRECSQDPRHVYNLSSNPPQVAGRCDIDDAPLRQRPDDTPEAVEKRINLYFEETAPLLDYYRQRGLLIKINADQPIGRVTNDLMEAITRAIQAG
jgi:adenylate kinase